jgi:branched-subunit amino acid ABC-type transport system permease component
MIQVLFNGLVTGLLVSLPALSLALTFSVARFANFAVGSMMTVGAYVIHLLNTSAGLPLPLAAAAGAAGCGLLAAALDQAVFRPLRGGGGVRLLLASMGLSIVLESAVRLVFGNEPMGFRVAVAKPVRLGTILRVNHEQLVVALTALAALVLVWAIFHHSRAGRAMRAVADNPSLAAARGISVERVVSGVWVLSGALAALALVWAIFHHSRAGRAMRAVADNPSLAAARGISVERVVSGVWILSGALAALAGLMVGLDSTLDPQMGWNYIVMVFAATILGGVSNPVGAIPGALIMGVLSEASTLVVAPHYRTLTAMAAMGLLLALRPSGLFSSRFLER